MAIQFKEKNLIEKFLPSPVKRGTQKQSVFFSLFRTDKIRNVDGMDGTLVKEISRPVIDEVDRL